MHCAPLDFVRPEAGVPFEGSLQKTRSHGVGLMRPLEAAAKRANIPILLDHHMDSLIRENQTSGRVLGVVANNKGKMVNFRARKAVILATGGSTGNVNFRRIFDPRLTEEYCGVAGEPHSFQDASGEIGRHGGWGIVVGSLQPGWRIRYQYHQAGMDRLPVRISRSEVAAGKRLFQGGRRFRSYRIRLAGRDPGEPGRPALLRRNRRGVHLQSKRRRSTRTSRAVTATC